jgi:hypothetical protein
MSDFMITLRRHTRLVAFGAFVAGCLVASCASTPLRATDTRPLVPIGDAAVQVIANGCRQVEVHGAGMMVAAGRVATVAHVVAGAKTIQVRSPRGVTDATVVYIDPVLDVAVLKVDPSIATPIPIGAAAPGNRGEVVVYRDDAPVTLPAQVQRLVNIQTADIHGNGKHIRPGYELTLDIRAGDSGAVVVIANQAVALVWATSREAKSRAWAMRASLLEDHLGASTPVPTGECA